MKIYTSQREVEKDIKDGILDIEGDVKFECSISIEASIHINAGNITARNITARDINARNITARDISYYAFLCAYIGIKCKSFKARRDNNHQDPICLDGKLEIIKEEKPAESLSGKKVKVELDGKSYTATID